jgi:putative ABC transport system permease protein
MSFLRDLKIAIRSLSRTPALWITVALTLALGIGANAAIFSVVRAVLLRPLANKDEDRLLYIRQSAPGLGADNTTFSVPEIKDIGSKLKSISELGTFSEMDFTVVGLGTPRELHAGVVDGNYFQVMGLRPVLGRLLTPADDGPNATGAAVLTYRFWTSSLHSVLRAPATRATPSSSASSSLPCPTPSKPRSSPTSLPARITSPPPWSPAANIA